MLIFIFHFHKPGPTSFSQSTAAEAVYTTSWHPTFSKWVRRPSQYPLTHIPWARMPTKHSPLIYNMGLRLHVAHIPLI